MYDIDGRKSRHSVICTVTVMDCTREADLLNGGEQGGLN